MVHEAVNAFLQGYSQIAHIIKKYDLIWVHLQPLTTMRVQYLTQHVLPQIWSRVGQPELSLKNHIYVLSHLSEGNI